MFLSIVIPAYNEEKRIRRTLQSIISFLERKNYDYEIIIVDDGSNDRTVETGQRVLADPFHLRVFRHECNLGKGATIKTGMLKAEGQYILCMGADSSTPIEEFDKFISALESGYPVIIGSRKLPDAQIEKHQPFIREFLGKCFTHLSNLFLGMQISDFTCGFKCFRKDAGQRICSRQTIRGWSYDSEILFLAKLFSYPIKEVPVRWINDPHSKVRIIRDTVGSLLGLMKIKINSIIGKYG